MQPELSAFQIVETCAAIKRQYRTLSANGEKRIRYAIYFQNPSVSQDWQMYASADSKMQELEKFDEAFDYITKHPNGAIRVRVVFMDSHSKPLADQSIPILSITDRVAAPSHAIPANNTGMQGVDASVASAQPQPQSFAGNVGAMLELMGFNGLSGTDDSPMGALGAILQVRDGLKDAQYERQDLMKKFEDKITENAGLKQRVEILEREAEERQAEIYRLEDANDDLQDKVEELQVELQKRETISGIGSIAIQKLAGNIIKRNPEKVSRLLGISSEDMLGMIEGSGEQQSQSATQPIPTVEVEVEDPRDEALKPFVAFAKTLDEQTYQSLTTILDVFRADSRTITIVLNMIRKAQHGGVRDAEDVSAVELDE